MLVLIVIIIYYEGRSLNFYKNEIIKKFFVNEINYTSSLRNRINETLLNEIYLDIQKQVKRFLNETSLLNFVNNESNNQFDNCIFNMCVMIKK